MNKFETTMNTKFDYRALVTEAKSLGLGTTGKAAEIDARINEHKQQAEATAGDDGVIHVAEIIEKVERRGRPVDLNSPRQIRLSQQGLVGRGRPADPNSAWNIRQRELEAKRAAGILKLGRQVNPDSERQKRLAKVGTVKRGRPTFVKTEEQITEAVVIEETVS